MQYFEIKIWGDGPDPFMGYILGKRTIPLCEQTDAALAALVLGTPAADRRFGGRSARDIRPDGIEAAAASEYMARYPACPTTGKAWARKAWAAARDLTEREAEVPE